VVLQERPPPTRPSGLMRAAGIFERLGGRSPRCRAPASSSDVQRRDQASDRFRNLTRRFSAHSSDGCARAGSMAVAPISGMTKPLIVSAAVIQRCASSTGGRGPRHRRRSIGIRRPRLAQGRQARPSGGSRTEPRYRSECSGPKRSARAPAPAEEQPGFLLMSPRA